MDVGAKKGTQLLGAFLAAPLFRSRQESCIRYVLSNLLDAQLSDLTGHPAATDRSVVGQKIRAQSLVSC